MVDARFRSTIETFDSSNAAVLATTRYVQPAPYGVVGPLLRPGRTVTSTTSAEADVAEQMAALALMAAAITVVRAIRESVIPAGRFHLDGCYRLSAVIATRFGWSLTRGSVTPASE
jgi:hypothetical protein